jgi:hypothetical protein
VDFGYRVVFNRIYRDKRVCPVSLCVFRAPLQWDALVVLYLDFLFFKN